MKTVLNNNIKQSHSGAAFLTGGEMPAVLSACNAEP